MQALRQIILLSSALDEKGGVLPDDINYVVCTHGHSDHVGNLNLFPDATFIVSYDVSKKDEYTVHRFEDGLPYKIDDGENVNYNFHNYASLGTSNNFTKNYTNPVKNYYFIYIAHDKFPSKVS